MSEYDAQQLDMLEPAYLARFDLKQPPFSPALDERFFYLDAERAQLLALVRQLIESDESLLLVNGERGSGKTSLLQYFVRRADETWRICQVDAHATMDADQLLWRISQGFGIGEPSRDPALLQHMLYEHMSALHRGGLIPVLLVDNAHELPVGALETIGTLANAKTADGTRLLLTILFCEPEIESLLDTPALETLRRSIGHTLEMPRLSVEQTAEYLLHRLNAAGHLGESLFSLKDIRGIQKAADGLPGHINERAHLWLNRRIGKTSGATTSGNGQWIGDRWFLVVGLVVVALAAIFVAYRHLRTPPRPTQITQIAGPTPSQTQRQLPLAVPPARSVTAQPPRLGAKPPPPSDQLTASPANESTDSTPALASAAVAQTRSAPASTSPAKAQTQAQLQTPAASTGTDTTERTTARVESTPHAAAPDNAAQNRGAGPLVTHVSPDPLPASRTPLSIVLSGRGFSPDTVVSITDTAGHKRLGPDQVSIESDNRLVLHVSTGTQPDTWNISVQDPGTGKTAHTSVQVAGQTARTASTQAKSGTEATKIHTDAWLLARNPAHFTLQLLSTRTPGAIATFVRQHGLSGDLAHFHTAVKGVQWYTLVQGDYANRSGAAAAARQLPASLNGLKPWVRHFSDIQSAIRAGHSVRAPAANLPPADIPSANPTPSNDHDLSWLWSQDPSAYTLQLLATHNLAHVTGFIKKHHLHGKAVYFHSHHDGQDWYSLVYGVYSGRDQANTAIKHLPTDLREAKPWARSFASVQAELSSTKPSAQP